MARSRYQVRLKRFAVKEIQAIPRQADRSRILERIGALADHPQPSSARKLSGRDRYRLRQGPYRILYQIEDDVLVVYVVRVAHRRETYRDH